MLSRHPITDVIIPSGMEPGEIIKEAREKRNWSQKELGDRVGISQPGIKKIEDGVTTQSKFMPRIAQVLELDLAQLDSTLHSQIIEDYKPPLQKNGKPDFKIYA